jgi:hypothetical protein
VKLYFWGAKSKEIFKSFHLKGNKLFTHIYEKKKDYWWWYKLKIIPAPVVHKTKEGKE